MKKFSKKITAIVGTATLAVGLMALPALAGTTQLQGNGWVGQMQGFMQQTFSPGQQQTLMNSTAMQNLHNSAGMQNAVQTGDVKAMQDLMNSDPNVKAQVGQDNLDKMNQFMSQSGGNMMTNGSGATSPGSAMMNGSGTAKLGSNMMNF
ncbi:hypothetical protein UF75_3389 [Desulfosporosinus sp. I2]|uniref:hypothetical protein n=1 Tax=Desulfosporosinus sp. I2 TaxID=1617025 RepID=UPI0005EEA455|nr:hypothetical protein [Desulfosporosinus sp. I2]KJR46240.1 hypothetical protein UF75_3389 [Desulfosporosinus sp. I2]